MHNIQIWFILCLYTNNSEKVLGVLGRKWSYTGTSLVPFNGEIYVSNADPITQQPASWCSYVGIPNTNLRLAWSSFDGESKLFYKVGDYKWKLS